MIGRRTGGPAEALVAVTYRCNARCRMCDIWKNDDFDGEVEPSFYYRLPKTLKNINITGGEPFLRDDPDRIVEAMADRLDRPRIVVSTNGLLTDRIRRFLPRMQKRRVRLAVRVSMDGVGEIHDRIRGVPGAYEKAVASIEAAKACGVDDLGVGFTLTADNIDEMMRVYEFAENRNIQFTATYAHDSPIFFGEHGDAKPEAEKAARAFEELARRQLRSWRPKNWFRAYFTDGLVDLLRGNPRPVRCTAAEDFFYLDPRGDAFACHLMDARLGNLGDASYDRLLENAPEVVRRVRRCKMNCWMTCIVAPWMRRNLPAVAHDVLKRKLRGGL